MEWFAYIAMLLAGVSLGLVGGGGSILTVPILVYLFNTPPSLATTYSLFVVGLASLFGTYRYQKRSLVAYRTALLFVVPSFLATLIMRRLVLPQLPEVILAIDGFILSKEKLIMLAFAVVMLGASVAMIRDRKNPPTSTQASSSRIAIVLLGFLVGSVAGFVGAGGGFLIIPALVVFAHLNMPMAVGTSLFIIALNSLTGFLADPMAAQVHWGLLLSISAAAALGIPLGSKLSERVPAQKLRQLFGWFVLSVGVFVLGSHLLV